ncbi:hypothetical protein TELCIR_07775 [Teladorsagia circumcincta]|uniref:SCP domain-containing protein n=1 Tax=Teladorsagia circumcincta TaxID=45464 RepID=A0A2G9UKX2_TELCI|nr:hypothetical protein TELCIR_07775 [Teladorsagia circumcincta]
MQMRSYKSPKASSGPLPHTTMRLGARALVATGRARNGYYPAEYAPPAALMYRLKYDCWAEAYAQAHVRSCSGQVSNPWQRPGWKENIHVLRTTATDDLGAIQNAIAKWQSELALNGVPSNMVYTRWMRDATRKVARHMTKETRWKGTKAREIGEGDKLYYNGEDTKRNGVAIAVAESLKDHVSAVGQR